MFGMSKVNVLDFVLHSGYGHHVLSQEDHKLIQLGR